MNPASGQHNMELRKNHSQGSDMIHLPATSWSTTGPLVCNLIGNISRIFPSLSIGEERSLDIQPHNLVLESWIVLGECQNVRVNVRVKSG